MIDEQGHILTADLVDRLRPWRGGTRHSHGPPKYARAMKVSTDLVVAGVAALAAVGSLGLAAEKRLREHREDQARLSVRTSKDQRRAQRNRREPVQGTGGSRRRPAQERLALLGVVCLILVAGIFLLRPFSTNRRPPEGPTRPHQRTVTNRPEDTDGDSVPDSKDKCVRVPAATPDGCPQEVRGLHPAFRQPEETLYRFLVSDRSLDQIPCVKAQTPPSLASGALVCEVRHRPVYFFRFPSQTVAKYYFSAMRNKQAVPASAGACRADSKTWNIDGVEQGPLAFLDRHHHFFVVWGYWASGSQNIGLIRGPMDEAGTICRYWEKEAF